MAHVGQKIALGLGQQGGVAGQLAQLLVAAPQSRGHQREAEQRPPQHHQIETALEGRGLIQLALFPRRQRGQPLHLDDLVTQAMVLHHLLIELLAESGKGHDLGLPGGGLHQPLLQLLQLTLFARVPAAPEVVAQPGKLGKIAGLLGPGRQRCQQCLELALETRRQVFDGHLHGVEPGEIQQIAIDVPLQRLGSGIIHRARVFAHLAHEAIQAV